MSAGTVIVSGMVAGTPFQGGATWAVLQYLIGLREHGWQTYFVEPVDGSAPGFGDRSIYCAEVMRAHGLDQHWALVPGPAAEPIGISRRRLREIAGEADLLLNVSGMLTDPGLLDRIPVRAYLDLDPAFNQLWHGAEGVDMRFDAHTHFVTIADAIGRPDCPIPDCDRDWLPTLPPVVLEQWPWAERLDRHALTTVGHWRSYGSIHHQGVQYGQKVHSLRPLVDLPRRAAVPLEVALAIDPGEDQDLTALAENGWTVIDPAAVAATPDDYRRFVQGSWAEFGLAKSGYVVSGSGWFSDRSACYLASGRPVIAQDTGFGRRLPTGAGLLAFGSADDVVAAIDELEVDYDRHRAAAREVAVEYLSADRVLADLLERLLG